MSEEIEESFAICDECLGSSDDIKMIKQANGAECKLCTRPCTVFRWNGKSSSRRSGKTVICYTCAREKNCCQSCMLDINYHIPIDIRDTALRLAGISNSQKFLTGPTKNSEAKAILADKNEQKFKDSDENIDEEDSSEKKAREILSKLGEKLKNATRKAPKDDKSKNDLNPKLNADISKLLSKLPFGGNLQSQKNPDLTSFFLFGFNTDLPIYAVSNYANRFGKIKSLTIIHKAKCGFITFTTRSAAEKFAEDISNNGLNQNDSTAGIVIFEGNHPCRVSWGKVQPLGTSNQEHAKLSIVVSKVLKQLAEKDIKQDKSRNITDKTSQRQLPSTGAQKKIKNSKSNNNQYKSLRSDYEI
ncbi:Pre-mRNA-splicing factor SLT11 [Scheffersomyces amazonensis]|uniref:Pre-mRNA-splicing factor SLT11 n=1 Tax=Scheffersomyces amazonensis TaxID=1078765 RepID=UPI00315CE30A